jgi:sugar fermentation stimulation protein A
MSKNSFRPLDMTQAQKVRFLARPNRFLVHCELQGKRVSAFMPNPGRLQELLLPDVTLYLTPNDGSKERKTDYTAVAVERDGMPVFLHTHVNNHVAEHLLREKLIPGFETLEVVRSEVPVGRSRFDFLLREGKDDVYCEVKMVTLFHGRVAMFPDAITERGRRHMLELAEMAERGIKTRVLFLVHSPAARWFMPDYHTDLAFSQTFVDLRDRLNIAAVGVSWRKDMSLSNTVRPIEIPWDYLEREVADTGAYLLIMELKRPRRIEIGSLGNIRFEKGWYIYVGSAMANLSKRVARHLRMRKKLHWHIDYLRQVADNVTALPIRSSTREECMIAAKLSGIYGIGSEGFGSSDCHCPAHLFYSPAAPIPTREFQDTLLGLRMREPEIM